MMKMEMQATNKATKNGDANNQLQGTETEHSNKENENDDSETEDKNRKANPTEQREKDPTLEAFWNVKSQEDLEILLADCNKKKPGTSKVSETEIKTQN